MALTDAQIAEMDSLVGSVFDLDASIRDVSKEEQVDPNFVRSVVGVESGGDVSAVSHRGARGLGQLMPETAAELGVDPDDPVDNLRGTARYLKQNLDRYDNDERLALVAYHSGPSGANQIHMNMLATGDFEVPRTARFWDGKKDSQGNPIPGTGMYTADYVEKILGRKKKEAPSVTLSEEDVADMDSLLAASVEKEPEAERGGAGFVEETRKKMMSRGEAVESRYQESVVESGRLTEEEFAEKIGKDNRTAWNYYRFQKQHQRPQAFLGGVTGAAIPFASRLKSPAQEEAEEAEPAAATVGKIVGTGVGVIGTSGAVKGILSKVPALKGSKLAVDALTRMGTGAFVTGHQQEWEKDFKDSLLNTLETAGAGLVSVVPEVWGPPNAWQLLLQPATDVVYGLTTGALRGREGKELAIQAFLDVALGFGFAVKDVASGQLVDYQKDAKAEVARMMSDAKFKGFEIVQGRQAKAVEIKFGKQAQAEADRLGIKYAGVEPGIPGSKIKPTLSFRDPVSNTNFNVKPGESVEVQLTRKRAEFATTKEDVEGVPPPEGGEGFDIVTTKPEAVQQRLFGGEEPEPGVSEIVVGKRPPFEEGAQRVTDPEDLEQAELPERKRGLMSAVGAVGEEGQVRIGGEQAEAKFDKIDEDLRKRFVKHFSEALRDAWDFAGKLSVDSNYYVKRLMKGDPGAERVLSNYIALKGASGDVKQEFSNIERDATRNLPQSYEKLLSRYRTAKRIVEIEDYYREADPNRKFKHPGGIAYDEAKSFVGSVEGDATAGPIIRAASDKIDSGYRGVLDLLHKEGMINDASYQTLSENYKHYEPRLFAQHIDPTYISTGPQGRKVSVSDSGVKSLDEGSEQAAMVNWRYSLADHINRAYRRIYKNRASKALFDYATENPNNPLGAEAVDYPTRTMSMEESDGTTVTVPAGKELPPAPAGKDYISTMVDGERKAVLVSKKIADSWNGGGEIHNSMVANVLRVLGGGSLTRMAATGILAPEFAIANIPMDALYSWLRYSKGYSKILPVAMIQKIGDLVKVSGDAASGKGEWENYVKQGGSMEFLYEQGRAFRKDPTATKTTSKESSEQIRNAVTFLQQWSERAGRLATRRRLIKKGYTPEQATILTRDGLDFSQGGDLVKFLDNLIPYLNPGTQATRGVLSAAREDPAVFTFKVSQLVATGAMLAAYNRLTDKDGANKVSDREGINNFVVNLPIKVKDDRGEDRHVYLRARKDQGQRVWSTIGETLVERMAGDITGEQARDKIDMAIGDLLPATATDLMPPNVKFFVSYINNRDFWMNEDIWRGREGVSPHKEFYPGYTPQALIDVAGAASKAGIEVSPARLHGAGRSVLGPNIATGSAGWVYENVLRDLPEKDRRKADKSIYLKLKDLPFARKIVRVTRPQAHREKRAAEDAERYGIDPKGKTLKVLQAEVDKAKRKRADFRQDLDNELRVAYKRGDRYARAVVYTAKKRHGKAEARRLARLYKRLSGRTITVR